VTTGLVALPMSAASFAVSASLGRVMHRLRPGRVIGGGLLLIGVGDLLGFALVHAWASWPALLPGFLVVGLGIGLATPPLSSAGTAAVPAERGGMAGGAIYTARQVGFAFGIALLGSVFTAGATVAAGMAAVLAVGGIVGVAAGLISFVMLRQPQDQGTDPPVQHQEGPLHHVQAASGPAATEWIPCPRR